MERQKKNVKMLLMEKEEGREEGVNGREKLLITVINYEFQ